MAIRRRITKSPLRKQLEQVMELSWSEGHALLQREGHLPVPLYDQAHSLAGEFVDIETDEREFENMSPPTMLLVDPADWKRVEEIINKLLGIVSEQADELYDWESRFGDA